MPRLLRFFALTSAIAWSFVSPARADLSLDGINTHLTAIDPSPTAARQPAPPTEEKPDFVTDLHGTWSLANSEPGPLRQSHSQVYDPGRKRMILFGGADAQDHNDTWQLDLNANPIWSPLGTVGSVPSVRRLHGAIYDPVRDRMLVFGGYSGSYFNDLWELSFTTSPPTWTQLFPAGSIPAPRAGHTVAYDPAADRLLVFGGHDGVSPPFLRRNDLWELPLAGALAWHELEPSGTPPSPRSSHSTCYDPVRQRLLVFGGTESGTSFLNDVWALSLTGSLAWTPITPAGTSPAGREEHSAIYEPVADRMVIFAGYDQTFTFLNDTWSLSLAAPAWSPLLPSSQPLERWGHKAIYDPVERRMIVHGGFTYYSYTRSTPMLYFTASPSWVVGSPARQGHSMIYDPSRTRVILFGGADFQDHDDTWQYTPLPGALWTLLVTQGAPPSPRRLHGAIYDPVRDRMLVFGGYAGVYFNDLWQLSFTTSPPTWTQLSPAGPAPAPRAGHTVAYDPGADRLLVFGGHDGVSPPFLRRNDVWELPLAGSLAWHEITPAGTPPSPRSSHSTCYDPPRQRLLICGGTQSPTMFLNDVWALSLTGTPTWGQLTPAGTPPSSREEHSAIYDPIADRMVVFAGYDQTFTYLNDTWSLSLAAPTWTQLAPTGVPPIERWGHKAVLDPLANRMIIHGGYTYYSYSPETWYLTWELTTPVEVASFTATNAPGVVDLRWTTALEAEILHFDVYRSEGEARVRITPESVPAQGAPGDYHVVDAAVEAGDRYVYELEMTATNGEPAIVGRAEILVILTLPTAVSLRQNHPNPFNPSTLIRFELPAPGHTTLRVFDSSGRLVRTLIDSELGATTHEVTWDGQNEDGQAVGSGVYVYRLETPARVLSRKMVLTR